MDPALLFPHVYIPQIPAGFSIRLPSADETLDEVARTPNSTFFYGMYLQAGLYLPLQKAIAEYLAINQIAICQFAPNCYRVMTALVAMFQSRGVVLSGQDLCLLLQPVKRTDQVKLRLFSATVQGLVTETPRSDKFWGCKPAVIEGDIWANLDRSAVGNPPPASGNLDRTWPATLKLAELPVNIFDAVMELKALSAADRNWANWYTRLPAELNNQVREHLVLYFSLEAKYKYYDPIMPGAVLGVLDITPISATTILSSDDEVPAARRTTRSTATAPDTDSAAAPPQEDAADTELQQEVAAEDIPSPVPDKVPATPAKRGSSADTLRARKKQTVSRPRQVRPAKSAADKPAEDAAEQEILTPAAAEDDIPEDAPLFPEFNSAEEVDNLAQMKVAPGGGQDVVLEDDAGAIAPEQDSVPADMAVDPNDAGPTPDSDPLKIDAVLGPVAPEISEEVPDKPAETPADKAANLEAAKPVTAAADKVSDLDAAKSDSALVDTITTSSAAPEETVSPQIVVAPDSAEERVVPTSAEEQPDKGKSPAVDLSSPAAVLELLASADMAEGQPDSWKDMLDAGIQTMLKTLVQFAKVQKIAGSCSAADSAEHQVLEKELSEARAIIESQKLFMKGQEEALLECRREINRLEDNLALQSFQVAEGRSIRLERDLAELQQKSSDTIATLRRDLRSAQASARESHAAAEAQKLETKRLQGLADKATYWECRYDSLLRLLADHKVQYDDLLMDHHSIVHEQNLLNHRLEKLQGAAERSQVLEIENEALMKKLQTSSNLITRMISESGRMDAALTGLAADQPSNLRLHAWQAEEVLLRQALVDAQNATPGLVADKIESILAAHKEEITAAEKKSYAAGFRSGSQRILADDLRSRRDHHGLAAEAETFVFDFAAVLQGKLPELREKWLRKYSKAAEASTSGVKLIEDTPPAE